jgi:hypothetical protein
MSADQEICYDFSIELLRNKRVSDVTYAGQALLRRQGRARESQDRSWVKSNDLPTWS